MNQVFDAAARIATPLALAGFLGAVLFFILRQVIQARIIPGVRRHEAAPVLLHIVNLLFVLCLIAMILGFAGFVIQLRAQASPLTFTSPTAAPPKQKSSAPLPSTPLPAEPVSGSDAPAKVVESNPKGSSDQPQFPQSEPQTRSSAQPPPINSTTLNLTGGDNSNVFNAPNSAFIINPMPKPPETVPAHTERSSDVMAVPTEAPVNKTVPSVNPSNVAIGNSAVSQTAKPRGINDPSSKAFTRMSYKGSSKESRIDLESSIDGKRIPLVDKSVSVSIQYKDGPLTATEQFKTDTDGIVRVAKISSRGMPAPTYRVFRFDGDAANRPCQTRVKIR